MPGADPSTATQKVSLFNAPAKRLFQSLIPLVNVNILNCQPLINVKKSTRTAAGREGGHLNNHNILLISHKGVHNKYRQGRHYASSLFVVLIKIDKREWRTSIILLFYPNNEYISDFLIKKEYYS